MFTIRQPLKSDLPRLADIAAAVDIRCVPSLQRGFLLFPWTERQFLAHVRRGHLLYAFVDSSGMAQGFLSGFTNRDVEECLAKKQEEAQAILLAAMRSAAERHGDRNYTIIYQIALAPNLQAKGFGAQCYKLFAQLVAGPFYGVVLEKPVRSIRLTFWWGLGFRQRVGEVSAPLPPALSSRLARNADDTTMTWGIFRNQNLLHQKGAT